MTKTWFFVATLIGVCFCPAGISFADSLAPFEDSRIGSTVTDSGYLVQDQRDQYSVVYWTDTGHRINPAIVPSGLDVGKVLGRRAKITATIEQHNKANGSSTRVLKIVKMLPDF